MLLSTDCNGNVTTTTHFVCNGLCHQIVMGMSPERLISFSMACVTRLYVNVTSTTHSVFKGLCHQIVMGMSSE